MRWRWIILIVALAVLAGLPLVAVHRVLTTEAGLQWALTQLERIPAVRVEAHGASGTLAGPLTVQRLVVDHEAARIEAQGVTLDVQLRSLLAGDVYLERSSVERLEVTLKKREPPPPEAPRFLPQFLEVVAPSLQVGNVGLTLADGQRFTVASVRSALAMTRWRIDLTDLVVADPLGRIDGTLTLRATLPLGLRTAMNGHWRLPDERTYRFAAAARGNLASPPSLRTSSRGTTSSAWSRRNVCAPRTRSVSGSSCSPWKGTRRWGTAPSRGGASLTRRWRTSSRRWAGSRGTSPCSARG